MCVYNVDAAVCLSHLIYLGAVVQSFPQKLEVLKISLIFEDIFKSTYTSTYRICETLPETRRKLCTQVTINTPGALISSPNNFHKG